MPSSKIADIYGRDLGAKSFRKGPWNSNPPSKHLSERVVTELGFMTILRGHSKLGTVLVYAMQFTKYDPYKMYDEVNILRLNCHVTTLISLINE